MREVMTRRDLDNQVCGTPGCDHTNHRGEPLFLHSACHPSAGTQVKYQDGVIEIACRRCERHVVAIRIADEPTPVIFRQ